MGPMPSIKVALMIRWGFRAIRFGYLIATSR